MGRGLSALMADVGVGADDARPAQPRDRTIPVEAIRPNPNQPRRVFDEEKLADLATSIARRGVIQPLIVRESASGDGYDLVAGERRWRAAQMAKLHEVPVVIRTFTDAELAEVAIIENIQRDDLTPVEEARGYRHLMQAFQHTQEQLSEILGKSRSHVANTLRLLSLPDTVLDHVEAGRLSAGHARALITADDPAALAAQVIRRNLSVRETEALVKKPKNTPSAPRKSAAQPKDADTRALEGDLSAALGMAVSIDHGSAGDGGRLSIRYHDLDQLDGLCQLLSNGLQGDER